MILSQVTDNENGTRTIHQHIENIVCFEIDQKGRILYIIKNDLTQVYEVERIEGTRITIKGDFK